MSWQLFEREAPRYEDWYETPRGRRASGAETQLLGRLLRAFPSARSALEVGCGPGHFTSRLAQHGLWAVGLDRSPAMLAVLRKRLPGFSAVLADAHALPFRAGSVDLVVFVTTLEFLADPCRALSEAVRVARRGLIAIALNRISVGGLSRRIGPASRGALLSAARDLSPRALRSPCEAAAAKRLLRLHSLTALHPRPFSARPSRLPLGDVVGVAAELAPE